MLTITTGIADASPGVTTAWTVPAGAASISMMTARAEANTADDPTTQNCTLVPDDAPPVTGAHENRAACVERFVALHRVEGLDGRATVVDQLGAVA